ncbi:hypothetical protein [Tsuneonella sp. HG222]
MTIQTLGARKRPTLSLNYAAMAHSPTFTRRPNRSPTLSAEELRREVALMVG